MKFKIIISLCLSLIISAFFGFIVSQTEIKEWPVMTLITFVVGALIILGVMCCVDDN